MIRPPFSKTFADVAVSSRDDLGARIARWFNEGHLSDHDPGTPASHTAAWWKVMCLTGVDYFSTLAYQPSIAFVAAGALSPLATLVLVALTLFGAFPMYSRVADLSPWGQGSILILEKLFPRWKGKAVVLCLLGFAGTGFVITVTLSAADAAAHLIQNPLAPAWLDHPLLLTIALLLILGAVFLKGFQEAITLAVGIVAVYMTLNIVVLGAGLMEIWQRPAVIDNWKAALFTEHGHPLMMIAMALILFPKLALGLSGFETGVAVMPHIAGDRAARIKGAKRLLTTAAVVMSVFLLTSSVVTTVLIPQSAYEVGGGANGRALAYLAHENLGSAFGTVYDVSTVAILWFAGASAMAGLLNLVPRYLPRYGMAPAWARAVRPLVLVFTGTAFLITIIFHANVDEQGGAYATGVLMLITSAATAVTLSARRRKQRGRMIAFAVITVIFVYTTVANIVERPDGVKIAAFFILAIIVVSLLSRLQRAFELRVTGIDTDAKAQELLREMAQHPVRLIANEPDRRDAHEYRAKIHQIMADNDLPDDHDVIFVEVTVTDASDFETELHVRGEVVHRHYRILAVSSSSVPSAIAALMLHIRDVTGRRPHIYFEWTEGNPVANFIRYLIFGQGEVAPVTREMIRKAEPRRNQRPHVHVG